MARHAKLWAPMVTVAMILIAVTVAFLGVGTFSIVARLLSDRSAPVSATTPAEVVEQTPPWVDDQTSSPTYAPDLAAMVVRLAVERQCECVVAGPPACAP